MITFNGKKFAKNDSEFTDSLFQKGGTCSGYYKASKKGVHLMDMQKKPLGFIVNKDGGFIVSYSVLDNGKTRYGFSTSSLDDKKLGIDKLGYMATIDACKATLKQVDASR